MQISDIFVAGKDRRCGKKATKATWKRYGKSNTNRKSLTSNLAKSNENRDFSNSFCLSIRPGRSLSPSSSNVVDGTSDLSETPVIDKETLSTTSTTSLHILKQATVNMEENNNSFMEEVLVAIAMSLPPKPNLTDPQMNPYYVVKRSGKVSKSNKCGALFDKRNSELYILKRNELDWWPKINKANLMKQWCQSARNRYCFLKLECLQRRRPLLSLPNVRHVSILQYYAVLRRINLRLTFEINMDFVYSRKLWIDIYIHIYISAIFLNFQM